MGCNFLRRKFVVWSFGWRTAEVEHRHKWAPNCESVTLKCDQKYYNSTWSIRNETQTRHKNKTETLKRLFMSKWVIIIRIIRAWLKHSVAVHKSTRLLSKTDDQYDSENILDYNRTPFIQDFAANSEETDHSHNFDIILVIDKLMNHIYITNCPLCGKY